MFRFALLALFATASPAVVVETTLLGAQPQGPTPLTATDGQGNVFLLVPPAPPCSTAQECTPGALVKLDAAGRVLFRRPLGEPLSRILPRSLAIDPQGHILIAGTTSDPGLPTLRPLQARHGGATDVYLWQLSPDGDRTTFASYLGGRAAEQLLSLSIDPTGQAVLVAQTASPDFPFTAVDESTMLPASAPRLAIVRLSPDNLRIHYAVGLSTLISSSAVSFGSDGTVYLLSPELPTVQIVLQSPSYVLREIAPDGTRRTRVLPLAPGTIPLRMLPSPDGSYWLAGLAIGDVLPTTAGALRADSGGLTYQRWEREEITTPPGPVRSLGIRQLAVDRTDENRIYAAALRGLARSDDNGWTWEIVNDTTPLRNVMNLATGHGRLWAITLGTAARPELRTSTDAGVTWTVIPLPGGLLPLNFSSVLATHPAEPDTLFLSIGSTLLSTRNAGESWAMRNLIDPINSIAVDERAVAVRTTQPGIFIISAGLTTPARHTLRWSDDGGQSFLRTVELPRPTTSIRFDPNEPGHLYIADANRFARTSRSTFPELEVLVPFAAPQPSLAQFGFERGQPGMILGAFTDGRLVRSDDAGRTWRPASSASPIAVPTQLQVAAGGVVHLSFPWVPESFLGKFTAEGEALYVTYLGFRGSATFSDLTRTASGLVVAVGQASGDFPGERLGASASPPSTPSPFVVAFEENTSLVYSAWLRSSGLTGLYWSGPGIGSTILLVGAASAADFPGLPPASDVSAGPTLFLSRVRPGE